MLWTSVALLLVQPIVALNYSMLLMFTACLGYCVCLLLYLLLVYCIVLYILYCLSCELWQLSRRSNRRSMVQFMAYSVRRYLRDVLQGDCQLPHVLHYYIAACCLWTSYWNIIFSRVQLTSILIFSVGQYMRGRHYGA